MESSAQNSAINPLAEKIHQQKIAVEQTPARNDGEAWLKLAVLHQDAAQYHEAERAYSKAIELLHAGNPLTLADALDLMGTMYVERGQTAKAEPLEEKALAIRENAKNALGTGISHMHLSALSLGKRDFSAAEAEATIAVSLLAPEDSHPAMRTEASPEEQMMALADLSLAQCMSGACNAAVPGLQRALRIAHAHYTAKSVPVGILDFLLGYAFWKSGNEHSAEEQMRSGTEEMATQLGWGHPTYLRALKSYRTFLSETGHTSEAQEVAARIAKLETPQTRAQAGSDNLPIGLGLLP